MRLHQLLRGSLVAFASVGVLFPQLGYAGTPVSLKRSETRQAAAEIRDLALDADGGLRGVVLDAAGRPAAALAVVVVRDGETEAGVTTDSEGRFLIRGLKAGNCHIATAYQIQACRIWTAEAAPPAAQRELLLVNGDSVVRGGLGNGGVASFLANPWVLAGIVAAAIAIPLTLDDDDDAS